MKRQRWSCLTSGVLSELEKRLLQNPDLEHSGILIGEPSTQTLTGLEFSPSALHPKRFELSQEWMLRVFYDVRNRCLKVAGFFHSHPNGCLDLSVRDRLGHPRGSQVLLVGLDEVGRITWKFYRLTENFPQAQRLTLVD